MGNIIIYFNALRHGGMDDFLLEYSFFKDAFAKKDDYTWRHRGLRSLCPVNFKPSSQLYNKKCMRLLLLIDKLCRLFAKGFCDNMKKWWFLLMIHG